MCISSRQSTKLVRPMGGFIGSDFTSQAHRTWPHMLPMTRLTGQHCSSRLGCQCSTPKSWRGTEDIRVRVKTSSTSNAGRWEQDTSCEKIRGVRRSAFPEVSYVHFRRPRENTTHVHSKIHTERTEDDDTSTYLPHSSRSRQEDPLSSDHVT